MKRDAMRLLGGGVLACCMVVPFGPSAAHAAGAELLIDGLPVPQVRVAELLRAHASIRMPADQWSSPPLGAAIACTDAATGDAGRAPLAILGRDGAVLRVDVAAAIPALPYPIDALRIESKPAAIMSQQARRSVALLEPDELRRRFRDTAAYMLQTAHHHYRMPYGDGALRCAIEVRPDAGPAVVTQGFEIAFGRGASDGPYPRAMSAVPTDLWPAWVVDADALPADLGADVVAAARAASAGLPPGATPVPALAAARRLTDDGGAPGPWVTLTLGLIGSRGTNPPRAARALALVSVAVSDALRLRRILLPAESPTAAPFGEHAVVAGAASTVLRDLFPDDVQLIDDAESAVLAAWPEDGPGLDGSAFDGAPHRLGRWVGMRVVTRAATDGSSATWSGVVPDDPTLWRSVAPGSTTPVEPLAGTWRPWNLASGDALRPPAPPRPGEAAFERELLEVRERGTAGDLDSQQLASFWEDKYGSFTPPGHWTAIALHTVRADGWSSDETALLMALLTTAMADSFIAAWDAKYAYWSVRPVTAIRDALDPSWTPYIPTPDFPSYVSGHATTSGAASTVLAALMPGRAGELRACAEQAAESRLIGGIHFRSDNEVGLALGGAVGARALDRVDPEAIAAVLPSGSEPIGCRWPGALLAQAG